MDDNIVLGLASFALAAIGVFATVLAFMSPKGNKAIRYALGSACLLLTVLFSVVGLYSFVNIDESATTLLPTPTPPTLTPVEIDPTPEPTQLNWTPTFTSVPPTDTPMPDTSTFIPIPPTDTLVPQTNTPVLPTGTPSPTNDCANATFVKDLGLWVWGQSRPPMPAPAGLCEVIFVHGDINDSGTCHVKEFGPGEPVQGLGDGTFRLLRISGTPEQIAAAEAQAQQVAANGAGGSCPWLP